MAEERIVLRKLSEYPYKSVAMGTTCANPTGLWRYWRPYYQTKRSPCDAYCPAGNYVVGFVRALAQNDWARAALLLREENPLAAVTGRVCHHPCEMNCNRGQYDGSVAIQAIERAIADVPVAPAPWPAPDVPRSATVVGSGPVGLTFSYFLTALGHRVTLIEEQPELGGVLRYGVPVHRLPREVLSAEIERLLGAGITVRTGSRLGHEVSLAELEGNHDAVLLAAGASRNAALRIRGEDAPGIMLGMESSRREGDGDVKASQGKGAPGGHSAAVGRGKRAALLLDALWRGLDPEAVLPRILVAGGRVVMAAKYRELLTGDPASTFEEIVTYDRLKPEFFKPSPRIVQPEETAHGTRARQQVGIVGDATPEQAAEEAGRCFSCGTCDACDNCWIYCPDLCISRQDGRYQIDYEYCKGCNLCAAVCPQGIISVTEEKKWNG